jgi:probable F420-dependent oxidoreductase
VKLGVVFPQLEIGTDPNAIRDYVQGVQELGFDHLVAYDHVLGADRATHTHLTERLRAEHMFHEILVLFGFIAGVAPKLGLATSIIVAPQRQTALLAKQAAEVDVLTAGKLRLGLGVGWNDVEFEALGMEFGNRGRRLEEQIELMRLLWTDPIVTYRGRWHAVTAAGLNPLPVQRPIPIWMGGASDAALERAARLADGFFQQRPSKEGWPVALEKLQAWVEEAGRDWSSFGIEQRLDVSNGTHDDWREAYDDARRLGATHLAFFTMNAGFESPADHLDRLNDALEAVR